VTAVLESTGASTAETVASSSTRSRPARREKRRDIQGLRALAVLLVVLYHSHVPGITGGYVGVDVFFVISGFLISTQLLRETALRGRVDLVGFYARRIRRLLPAALVVLVATLALARLLLSPLEVKGLVIDALYSAFYVLNYRLAADGVDYQEAGASASALQHYWSLAVEEQFYIVWPLLIAFCVFIGRRHWRQVVLGGLLVGTAVSLYASVTLTPTNAPLAYFAIHTRAWELGVGALVAIAAHRLVRLPQGLAAVLAWTGLGAIVVSALVYDDATAFPGVAAALPVAGAALVIAAGCGGTARSVDAVLGRRPVQGIGAVSYAWYLWHWPLLMILPLAWGDEAFSWGRNLEMCVLALWLATVTYFVVERPTQLSRLRKPVWLGLGAVMSAAAVVVALLVVATLPALAGQGAASDVVTSQTAADPQYVQQVQQEIATAAAIQAAPSNLTPALAAAGTDYPETSASPENCMASFVEVEQGACVYGDPNGSRTVVLFGDSHMEQWVPAFDLAAERAHWKVVSWTKWACPLMDQPVRNPQLNREYTECATWRDQTVQRIVDLRPDLVITGQSDRLPGQSVTDDVYAGTTMDTLAQLTTAGLAVHHMLDIAYPAGDVPVCVSASLTDVSQCSRPNEQDWISARGGVLAASLAAQGVPYTDPRGWQCSPTDCPVVVGNILVYRDDSHLTATYSRWLAPVVQPLLAVS